MILQDTLPIFFGGQNARRAICFQGRAVVFALQAEALQLTFEQWVYDWRRGQRWALRWFAHLQIRHQATDLREARNSRRNYAQGKNTRPQHKLSWCSAATMKLPAVPASPYPHQRPLKPIQPQLSMVNSEFKRRTLSPKTRLHDSGSAASTKLMTIDESELGSADRGTRVNTTLIVADVELPYRRPPASYAAHLARVQRSVCWDAHPTSAALSLMSDYSVYCVMLGA